MRVYLRHVLVREIEIPRYYKLSMERGTSIGGIVQDEDGRPIEGVTVEFYATSPDIWRPRSTKLRWHHRADRFERSLAYRPNSRRNSTSAIFISRFRTPNS